MDLLLATQAGGADVIELGVPCGDPFMDGPVISKCHEVARQQDVDLTQCLSDVMTAREKGLTVPVILVGYSGPFVAHGWNRLADDAVTAGVDGFLVPDCPPHEIDGVAAALATRGRAFVPLVTPTTTELDEVVDLAQRTGGRPLYVISKPGKTGCSAAGVEEVAAHGRGPPRGRRRADDDWLRRVDARARAGLRAARRRRRRRVGADPRDQRGPLAVRAPHHQFRGRTRRGDAASGSRAAALAQGSVA